MRTTDSKTKMVKWALMGGVWGFIGSSVVFPRRYFIAHIDFLRDNIPPETFIGDHFPPPWVPIFDFISQVVFFPAALFQTFGLLGVVMAVLFGALLGVVLWPLLYKLFLMVINTLKASP